MRTIEKRRRKDLSRSSHSVSLVFVRADSAGRQYHLYQLQHQGKGAPLGMLEAAAWHWPCQALARVAGQAILFNHTGFIEPRVKVSGNNSGLNEGLLRYNEEMSRGIYRAWDGSDYHWSWSVAPMGPRYFTDTSGRVLLEAQHVKSRETIAGRVAVPELILPDGEPDRPDCCMVELKDDGLGCPHLFILLMLDMFVFLCHTEEHA